jgi:hypothetical protein
LDPLFQSLNKQRKEEEIIQTAKFLRIFCKILKKYTSIVIATIIDNYMPTDICSNLMYVIYQISISDKFHPSLIQSFDEIVSISVYHYSDFDFPLIF